MSGIESLDVLTEQFARLPGIGRKTAGRLAYALLSYSDEEIAAFVHAVTDAKAKIHRCPVCQNLTDRELCPVCSAADIAHRSAISPAARQTILPQAWASNAKIIRRPPKISSAEGHIP